MQGLAMSPMQLPESQVVDLHANYAPFALFTESWSCVYRAVDSTGGCVTTEKEARFVIIGFSLDPYPRVLGPILVKIAKEFIKIQVNQL